MSFSQFVSFVALLVFAGPFLVFFVMAARLMWKCRKVKICQRCNRVMGEEHRRKGCPLSREPVRPGPSYEYLAAQQERTDEDKT